MCCRQYSSNPNPWSPLAEAKGMFLPEPEDVIECVNDDTDEGHESLNSIPELVEDSDEEDDAVNQGTYTSTPYASIDGSCVTCQVTVPGRVILSGESGAHFGREGRLTTFRVLTNCDVARFMFHLDHVSAHDDTRQYFISLPSLIAQCNDSCLGAPGKIDEGEELSWTVGHL